MGITIVMAIQKHWRVLFFLENKWCGLSKIPGELVLRGGRAGLVFCRSNCISNMSNISNITTCRSNMHTAYCILVKTCIRFAHLQVKYVE